MKSASAVDTDAIDNIATNGSLVYHFWNKQRNNILDLLLLFDPPLSDAWNFCSLPTRHLVVECSFIVLHSDLDGSLQ